MVSAPHEQAHPALAQLIDALGQLGDHVRTVRVARAHPSRTGRRWDAPVRAWRGGGAEPPSSVAWADGQHVTAAGVHFTLDRAAVDDPIGRAEARERVDPAGAVDVWWRTRSVVAPVDAAWAALRSAALILDHQPTDATGVERLFAALAHAPALPEAFLRLACRAAALGDPGAAIGWAELADGLRTRGIVPGPEHLQTWLVPERLSAWLRHLDPEASEHFRAVAHGRGLHAPTPRTGSSHG